MENIILTSTGFANRRIMKKAEEFFGTDPEVMTGKKAVIITTASKDKEKNEFALLAHSELNGMGFGDVEFFDFEKQYTRELMDFDLIYVNGGNTYYLLDWVKKSGFEEVAREFLKKDGMYIGVSAGSLIAGVSIEILNYVGGDVNEVGLEDFDGMKFINKAILPHFTEEREDAARQYEQLSGIEVIRLKDGEALIGSEDGGFYLMDDFTKEI